jgi:deoxyribodipyrimidine photolyase-related protein
MKTLVPLLGDQLSLDISSLQAVEKRNAIVLLCECADETSYVAHHKKKLVFVLSCMRHFKQQLHDDGWSVIYRQLDDENNRKSIASSIELAVAEHQCEQIVMTEVGEYRLRESLRALQSNLSIPMDLLPDTRFLCSTEAFQSWAASRKQLRMENFYRDMRRQTGLLMEDDKPVGGQWNFDKDNRKPAGRSVKFSDPLRFEPDDITRDVVALVDNHFPNNMGSVHDFWFACSASDANTALDHFIDFSLPQFGDYQDAMLHDQKFLAHSVLSLYINIGLLDPTNVCERVEAAFNDGHIPINAAEGFIRQIIGWREYVRGIYWLEMPQYLEQNFFDYHKPLPEFYWTADTRMACLKGSIQQTIDEGYAHHIQRLMITGNFAMLAGVDPKQVHEWYLAVYVDAYEWVELPNTLGMSQFADGGLLGSKPYAAGGNYINKMSDYCKHCDYKVSKKTGEDACPFNYLYWHFLSQNQEKLSSNHRMAQMYNTWGRMSEERKAEIHADATHFLESL